MSGCCDLACAECCGLLRWQRENLSVCVFERILKRGIILHSQDENAVSEGTEGEGRGGREWGCGRLIEVQFYVHSIP